MAAETSHYNLSHLVTIDMNEVIPEDILKEVLSKDPFIHIPGIINLRDVGANASSCLRRGLVYRSGALNHLSDDSKQRLAKELGIKLIVDLRSPAEVVRSPDPVIEGVKYARFESLKVPTPVDMGRFEVEGGKDGYVAMYAEILEIHQPSIKAVLEHVRDSGTPVLFHCTAGKDRTGVLAAIILGLAGCQPDVIARDYALTRLGVEPYRDMLFTMLKMWNKDWTRDTPGINGFSQVKGGFMLGTLELVEQKYGGVEGYIRDVVGFSDKDIEKVRQVLRE